jgi:tetratricopeptide (TPR) repeat protein
VGGSIEKSEGGAIALEESVSILSLAGGKPSQAIPIPVEFHIPYHRNPYFAGRETLLERIQTILHDPRRPELEEQSGQSGHAQAIAALSGMGGIGKTQVAVEYAYRYQHEYSAILWARAESYEALYADTVTIAQQLKLADALASEAQQPAQTAQAVQAFTDWLKTRAGWLLILDNIEDMSLAYRFVPSVSRGHILLTTRAQSTSTLAPRIEVEKMTVDEGTQFLLYRSKMYAPGTRLEEIAGPDWLEAQDIYRLMDGLPLALDQAGAYIEETGCTLHHYIERFRQQRASLLEQRGESSQLHPEAVTSTILLALEKVERANPAAVDLLRLCSFLDAGCVNEEILEEQELDTLIAALRKYSLISRSPDERTLTLHPLVQAVMYDHMEPETQHAWAERAIDAVSGAFPSGEKVTAWPRCERCIPHVYACLQHIERWQLLSPAAARMLDQAGLYLLTQGQYTQAERLLQKALYMHETLQPAEQHAISETLNSLASCFYYLGKYAQAEGLFSRVLAMCEDLNGAVHQDVANALNNLALLYHKQGKYAQAESRLQQALSIWEQLQVTAHPDLARTLNDLAMLHHQQGRLHEAKEYYLRGLAIWEQVIGPSHPDLAVHLNNLATLYAQQRNYTLAAPLFQRALKIRERTLGPDHPITAHSLVYLARSYQHQWRYAEAELLFTRALTIRKRTLGPEHPEIAYSLCNLARLYLSQGKHTEAELLYKQALAIREKTLGPDHPDVATLLRNYAILLMSMKRKDEAIQLFRRAKAIYAKQDETSRIRP